MKHLFITLTAATLLLGTCFAHAGGYRGHYSGYHGSHYGGHYSGHYSGHYGYRGSRRAADYLVGGLILGGILHYAFSHPHRRGHNGYHHRSHSHHSYRSSYTTPRSHRVYREVVSRPYYKTYSNRPVIRQQSHLHKDRYGNCYEIRYGTQGDELRTEQPRSVCNW